MCLSVTPWATFSRIQSAVMTRIPHGTRFLTCNFFTYRYVWAPLARTAERRVVPHDEG